MLKNYRLRQMSKCDLPVVLSWRNHEQVRLFMFDQSTLTMEAHLSWFESAQQDPVRRLLILEHAGSPRGYLNLKQVCDGGVWEWGFYAAPGAPPGTGLSLTTIGLDYAFSVEKAHKVCGRVLAFNSRSLHIHAKIGFAHEGILRSQHVINGQWHDVHCLGCLRDDWKNALKTST